METSSMARTHGPHFHALLPEETSAPGTVRTPQPSQRSERGMESFHFASIGREARRPWDGPARSSSLRNSRSSACFKIWSRVHTGSGACGGRRTRSRSAHAPQTHLRFCAQVCFADARHSFHSTAYPRSSPTLKAQRSWFVHTVHRPSWKCAGAQGHSTPATKRTPRDWPGRAATRRWHSGRAWRRSRRRVRPETHCPFPASQLLPPQRLPPPARLTGGHARARHQT